MSTPSPTASKTESIPIADIAKIEPRSPFLSFPCANLFIFASFLNPLLQEGKPDYGLRGGGPDSKGFASATGNVGFMRLVLEDVPVEEPSLVSVPLFAFGSAAGSIAFAGSTGFGLTIGFSSLFWPVTEKPVLP